MGQKVKMYFVYRESFGDFDIKQREAVLGSHDKNILKSEANRLNDALSDEEKEQEIKYVVDGQITII